MHTCPDCYQSCSCGGDCDDLLFDDPPNGRACQCPCQDDQDWDDDGSWDDEDDDRPESPPPVQCATCGEWEHPCSCQLADDELPF